ncbi:diguanylate cyclase/phosphodiesterase with PAS/PAC sensor(s) [Candidatus Protofrankia datiscae]|uniref:Diguanylate cyclase/phosphodiesterase with PAS/PAC sensor(S) n=1 Tax=Candidatus Protofrankia datiscae TaxID=2716812 RepID=F8AWV0_9ACTN|nr:diguanylate cyclase/phosphodiesterase with PAS/PAC sensor(s) [Candidatus Protofrankia datiscae]
MVASMAGSVADVVSTGLLVVTSDSRVVWANRALLDLVATGGGAAYDDVAGTVRDHVGRDSADATEHSGVGPAGTADGGYPWGESDADPVYSARVAVAEAGLPLTGVVPDTGSRQAQWQAPDGTTHWLEVRARTLIGGRPAGFGQTIADSFVLYEITDVTERRHEEETLRLRERWLRHVETIARTGIWEWDLVTNEMEWSDELLAMLGYPTDTRIDYDAFRLLVHPDDRATVEDAFDQAITTVTPVEVTLRMYLADRVTECVLEWRGDVLTGDSGTPIRIMGTAHDVTELVRIRHELAHVSVHEPLTEVLNRRAVTVLLTERLATGVDRTGALLLVDIDNFKIVNDLRGHSVGDTVMRSVAQRLAETLPAAAIGRLGDDEFAVVLHSGDGLEALAVADTLREQVARYAIMVDGFAVRVTVTVGVVPLSAVGDCDTALAHAGLALTEAKEAGRNCAKLFTAERHEYLTRRALMVQRVRDALDAGLLTLQVQPIVDLASHEVQGYEVLLRLHDGQHPEIGPAEFMSVLAHSDLVLSLDRWVVQQTVAALASVAARGERLRLHVNISGRSVEDAGFADFVLSELRAARVDPSQLGIEIAESVAVAAADAVRQLAETLTGAGCRFTLDDFGVGLGSFVYLRNLPFTNVKIDGDFLRHVDTSPADAVLVDAVVRVARCLGMYTIAESIDRESLAPALRDLGVDYAQGFHLGPPRPLTELLAGTSDADPQTHEAGLNSFLG